jgi:aspartyl-tRNA(Asn)/glutamyl-tRNA(Gln) amidotransferase subunit A
LKDNVLTKGVRTTGSVSILDNYIGAYDATITTKLKDAGAVIIGKSALDGLGMGGTGTNCHTGFVHNPYDINRMAGGIFGRFGRIGGFGSCFFCHRFGYGGQRP